jgi:hypothetical protein
LAPVAIIEEEERRRPETRWRGDDRGRQFPADFEEAARHGDEDRLIAWFEKDPSLQFANDYLQTPRDRNLHAGLVEFCLVWYEIEASSEHGKAPGN